MRARKLRAPSHFCIQNHSVQLLKTVSLTGAIVLASGSSIAAEPVGWKNRAAVNQHEVRTAMQPASAALRVAASKNTPALSGGYVLVDLAGTPDHLV